MQAIMCPNSDIWVYFSMRVEYWGKELLVVEVGCDRVIALKTD